MHQMQMEHVVKQMLEERRRQAERDALVARHSRTGLLKQFLRTIAGRRVR